MLAALVALNLTALLLHLQFRASLTKFPLIDSYTSQP